MPGSRRMGAQRSCFDAVESAGGSRERDTATRMRLRPRVDDLNRVPAFRDLRVAERMRRRRCGGRLGWLGRAGRMLGMEGLGSKSARPAAVANRMTTVSAPAHGPERRGKLSPKGNWGAHSASRQPKAPSPRTGSCRRGRTASEVFGNVALHGMHWLGPAHLAWTKCP